MQNQNPFAQFTQNNPFAQFVQNNPFAEQMKSYSEFKSPNFDVNQMFSFSRRNAEAFSAASSVMVESMQNVSRNQAENFRTNVEEMLKTAKEMMGSGSPEINTTRQAEFMTQMATVCTTQPIQMDKPIRSICSLA